ncbi:MAG TPA: hypothetical protein VI958_12020, partial [Acidobacteriota bacterium]
MGKRKKKPIFSQPSRMKLRPRVTCDAKMLKAKLYAKQRSAQRMLFGSRIVAVFFHFASASAKHGTTLSFWS